LRDEEDACFYATKICTFDVTFSVGISQNGIAECRIGFLLTEEEGTSKVI
jgi:hypothetical protein